MPEDMGQCDEREMQALIWDYINSYFDSFALRSAVELGISDIIHSHGHPITLSQLSAACLSIDANPDCLHRLMRYLVRIGILVENTDDDDGEKFGLTSLSKLLVQSGEQYDSMGHLGLEGVDGAMASLDMELGRKSKRYSI
uniref:O-methyltransferase dimerisation domain-containing protein n=1 Tax=Nelumbo nucifera TaxID=4432 RepID=A0A822Y376_NELNU|nr:TPA_asm: hypothetical protein HUJ06_027217 [Nelumbo nucifera]